MEGELKELKSVFRSLVVSSPRQVDVRSLLHDHRELVGAPIPFAKFGYKDPVSFLRQQFSDCFLFQGPPTNPQLTLIVPDSLKHIDNFVRNQKVTVKNKSKKSSVLKRRASIFTETMENVKQNRKPHNKKLKNDRQVFQKRDRNVSAKEGETYEPSAVQKLFKKKSPLYNSHYVRNNNSDIDDSGRQTSRTSSNSKRTQLEELKQEVRYIISDHPNGVWCTDLPGLYRARHGCNLNFIRFGYASVLSLATTVPGIAMLHHPPSGDRLLADANRALPPLPTKGPCASPAPDSENVLPEIPHEVVVSPADIMHFPESIPGAALEGTVPGALAEVQAAEVHAAAVQAAEVQVAEVQAAEVQSAEVQAAEVQAAEVQAAEVYSPSHFWLQLLCGRHDIPMKDMIDAMKYYNSGEAKVRRLALGLVRFGQVFSCCYDGKWHHSLIVKILYCDTVDSTGACGVPGGHGDQ